jgi:hypothetical protein
MRNGVAPMIPPHPALNPDSPRAAAYSWLLYAQEKAGINLLPLLPGEKYRIPPQPLIALFVDDGSIGTTPIGPAGFNQPILKRLLRNANAVSLTTCGPDERVYATACAIDSFNRNVVLIETLPQFEIAWMERLNRRRTPLPVLVCTMPETMQ